ncbi:hypothetical protein [Corynebacterium sanguinis]|uniref:Uncharacterized protein n=1 Tax=Corynebacterium sanguinis TaxID=2594913 RepID=A0A6C1TUB7_9CORY|nr:hypothetical protein [Corynebacterium sanguinis]TVS26141.1 hypothetical protein EKI59_11140 [Corynebacterium sanguinis]
MAVTRKAEIRKQILEKERALIEKRADHLVAIFSAVEQIDDLSVQGASAIDELQEMGLSLTDIEESTGVSVRRLNGLRRRASVVRNETSDNDDDEDLGDRNGDSESGVHAQSEGDGLDHPYSDADQ